MSLAEPTLPFPLLLLYFQASEWPLFSTTIYKVSKLPCPFAFWSSPLFLSCPAPGRHTIDTTYQCWWFLARATCPFLLLRIPFQATLSRGNSFGPSHSLFWIKTSKTQFKTLVSLPRILRQQFPESWTVKKNLGAENTTNAKTFLCVVPWFSYLHH